MGLLGGILGGVGGAAGSIFGGISKNRQLKEQMKMLEQEKKENQQWFDRRYNEDATQRAEAQALLNKTEESIRNRNQQAAATAVVTGGTEESVAAARAANNQALTDATSNIVANNEQRKDAIEGQYMQTKSDLNSQMRQIKGQQKSIFDIASGAIGGAAGGIAMGID